MEKELKKVDNNPLSPYCTSTSSFESRTPFSFKFLTIYSVIIKFKTYANSLGHLALLADMYKRNMLNWQQLQKIGVPASEYLIII